MDSIKHKSSNDVKKKIEKWLKQQQRRILFKTEQILEPQNKNMDDEIYYTRAVLHLYYLTKGYVHDIKTHIGCRTPTIST